MPKSQNIGESEDGLSVFQWIQDREDQSREHEEAVKRLISRQKSAGKAGSRWRINVLKRELMGNSTTSASSHSASKSARVDLLAKSRQSNIAKQQQVFKHFEPELVKLAAAISKDRRKKAEKRKQDALKEGKSSVEHLKFKNNTNRDLDSSELVSDLSLQHNSDGLDTSTNRKGNTRLRKRKRKKKRSKNGRRTYQDGQTATQMKTTGVNFHPLLQLSGSRIHVVEGGATDFYSVNLRKRPKGVVHVAIQDPHLQVTVEPRVLRFSAKTFRIPQLVCVSAVDDTDKSSESVEYTVLEHVSASADAEFDRIRFEVPVSISDNDGHYLWGFGSNVNRQLGSDEAGPAATLPTEILGRLDPNRTRSQSGDSASQDKNSSGGGSENGRDSDEDGDGTESSRSLSNRSKPSISRQTTLGDSPKTARTIKKVGRRASFVSNAKQSKPSMLFASIAAGRHTTLTTQTNGNTTMYGRNDGLDWFDCRTMINGPAINAYSRAIGNAKTYIISVSAGSFHCAALTVDGQLLTWGRNDCGQLGIGKMGREAGKMNANMDMSKVKKKTEDVEDPVAKAKRRLMEKHDEMARQTASGSRKQERKKKKKGKQAENSSRRKKSSKLQSDKPVMVNHPTPVGGLLAGVKVFMVSCGDQHTAAIAGIDHNLYCWGRAMTGALGLHSRPESTRSDATSKSAVWVPGLSDRPHTSDEDSGNEEEGDTDNEFSRKFSNLSPRVKNKSVRRTVMSEPEGTCGGDVSMSDQWLPQLVEMPLTEQGNDPGPPFQVCCGYAHTAVICGAGRLYTCGWGGKGRLGRPIPIVTSTGSPPRGGSASGRKNQNRYPGQFERHSADKPILRMFFEAADPHFRQIRMPRTQDGAMSIYKPRRRHRTANPQRFGSEMPAADKRTHATLIVSVACGLAHTTCLTSDRTLWSWGDNSRGQLGLGHRNACPLPRLSRILIPFSRHFKRKQKKLTLLGVNHDESPRDHDADLQFRTQRDDLLAAIDCGDNHSCAITESGLLYVWGSNEFGQPGLGSGSTQDEILPRLHHPTLSLDVRQLSVGANHTLVITAECPDRVYHAKSTFEEVVRGQKKLVDIDTRRRKRFQKWMDTQEMARKVRKWRKPKSIMVPMTKKAHARTMTIQKEIFREMFAPAPGHKWKKPFPNRPDSGENSKMRRSRTIMEVSSKTSVSRGETVASQSSSGLGCRPPRRWELGLKPRPDFETMGKRSPFENSHRKITMPSRPRTAGSSDSAGPRRPEARPHTAGSSGKRNTPARL